MLHHLAEEFMHVTGFDVQPRDKIREGAAELSKGRVVVGCCYVAVREVKRI